MASVKKGLNFENVISRHQPSVMEGKNVASVDHGKDKYPRSYYKKDLRREVDKSDKGTKGDTKLYSDQEIQLV